MFNLFRKKSQKERLQDLYSKKLKEAYTLSHTNRTESDRLMAEAEEIAKKIENLD